MALWDGQEARGRGGTATVIATVRARGLPLAWIHIGSPDPATGEAGSLGDKQGCVTFERFPPS